MGPNMHKLLIVDDEARNRAAIRRLLRQEGYLLSEAQNGAQALELVSESLPDLIILDIIMPGISGYEVCRKLKSETETADIMILMLSGKNDLGDRLEGYAAGVDDFIMKPYEPEELQARVKILLRLKQTQKELQFEMIKRREVAEALRTSEEKYRTIVENMAEGYYEADLHGGFTFFNNSICRMTGYSRTELLLLKGMDLIHQADKRAIFRAFAGVYFSGVPQPAVGFAVLRKDGSIRQIETSITLIKTNSGDLLGFRGVTRDVDERKKYEERLIYTAYHDALTGLKNRKGFYEKLENVLLNARRYQGEVALFFIDIDKFKQVNDTLGHQVGDELLKEIAIRLKECLRETDFISRIGGDEFTIILDSPGLVSPKAVAKRIVHTISRPYNLLDRVIDYISASIGISLFPRDALDMTDFVKNADTAMYAAKKTGNCFIYYHHLGN